MSGGIRRRNGILGKAAVRCLNGMEGEDAIANLKSRNQRCPCMGSRW